MLASLWWVVGKRKWCGDVEWHIDNQGVVTGASKIRENTWSSVIESEDCDVWGLVKKILEDREIEGERVMCA